MKPLQATERALIADRYQLQGRLGEGGMARVYRARDLASGQDVAIKLLTVPAAPSPPTLARALFEREFQTLTQLRHPHVIEVYDYGVTAQGQPYYTMELLDGGDLRELAPLPWREACRLSFDVCSSLALLHCRRLLHRDVSPRNIRRTRDGKAKLIDFGATVPMSAGGTEIVGTPAFTAPETLHRLALDARTDLYSLGATLYYALTGRLPYPARQLSELTAAWGCKPAPPSSFTADVPAALDDLVLALINPEPALRPRAAGDVMQQLAACAGLPAQEAESVSLAYLATPLLVGRAELLSHVRQRLAIARSIRGTNLLITGEPGVGRSRVLNASALEARSLGFCVLRATASGARAALSVAHGLAKQLLVELPGSADPAFDALFSDGGGSGDGASGLALRNFAGDRANHDALQRALLLWWSKVSRTQPLFIAVDDAQRMDPASAAVLAALLDRARSQRVCVMLTADQSELSSEILSVLSRRCEQHTLAPLTREQTHELLGSLFGEVAHLSMLADELQRVSRGSARQCMELAHWLVDRAAIRYAAGTWILPDRLSASDLPDSATATLQSCIVAMSAPARQLAQAHALAYFEELTDQDYHALLPELTSRQVEESIRELLWGGAVVSHAECYTLANRAWSAALIASLTPAETAQRHRALAALYAEQATSAAIHHAFAGGLPELGLETMVRQHKQLQGDFDHAQLLERNIGKMMWCAAPAIETAERLGYSPRAIHELRRWHLAGNITIEHGAHDASAQLWFEQLAHDSGLDLYRADNSSDAADQRLMRALTLAQQRYLSTPERERVYAVDEAIRLLGEYVVCAIALGSRTQDSALLRRLPALLEPFVALSPVLEALWNNAIATERSQCGCQYEIARERWLGVLAKLETMTSAEFKHVVALRTAVAFAIGLMEAQLGLAGATRWADRLEHDPYHRISALHLRKLARIEQGDRRGAEVLRRQAEVLKLQMRSPQMFHALLLLELAACARVRDLGGIRHVTEEIRRLAAWHEGWVPSLICAEASFDLVRGDFASAKHKFESCRQLCAPNAVGESRNLAMWISAHQGLAEALLQLGNAQEARQSAAAALALCEDKGCSSAAFELVIALGLAEAALGDPRAAPRLEALIADQQRLGVTGLRLGLAFEARAQIAIWTDDRAAFEHYAALTQQAYGHGAHQPLASRYARLLNQAARHGWRDSATVSHLDSIRTGDLGTSASLELYSRVTRTLAGQQSPAQRARGIIELLCLQCRSDEGHLYLVTEQGLTLGATHAAEPNASLTARVQAWLEAERARAQALDATTTDQQPDCAGAADSLQLANVAYALRPLRCLVDGAVSLVGVAALKTSETPELGADVELLQLLAQHLLDARTSEGC